jgi:PPOX class probable F420-dependent enzyme
MELAQALDFIRSRKNGVVTALKADGRPQLSNITYLLADDGVIRISLTNSRAKTVNLRRDSRVSLHVTQEDFWAYAVIEGHAELTPVAASPDDATVEELVVLFRDVQGEHPNWDEYRAAMVSDQRLVLRIHPQRAYGMINR